MIYHAIAFSTYLAYRQVTDAFTNWSANPVMCFFAFYFQHLYYVWV